MKILDGINFDKDQNIRNSFNFTSPPPFNTQKEISVWNSSIRKSQLMLNPKLIRSSPYTYSGAVTWSHFDFKG